MAVLGSGCTLAADQADDIGAPADTSQPDDTGLPEDSDLPEDTTAEDTSEDTQDTQDTSVPDVECPEGMICPTEFPFVDANDTTDGTTDLDAYSCSPSTNESGPERTYQVTLDKAGFLAATLDNLGTSVDVDVHILEALDADDCIDRGNWDSGALLSAGTYYVVVDSWVSGSGAVKSGDYELTLGFTPFDAFEAEDLDPDVLSAGLFAFDAAWMWGDTDRLEYTIIDFSLFSGYKRWWTIDLRTGDLLFNEWVTHGSGSEDEDNLGYADSFSNIVDSHQSSLGLMRTDSRYTGDNGLSLRLDGLEDGINDRVRERAIVVHGAWYTGADFVAEYGYSGNSWGCTAVDDDVIEDVIDTLEGGALMWSWYPDDSLAASEYLDGWAP